MPHFAAGSPGSQSSMAVRANPAELAQPELEMRKKHTIVKNRRLRYLERRPEYFDEADLELADPLLYDRLIRRFQTTDEREREGRERGYTGSLEADLVRSEAKLEALKHPDPNSPIVYRRAADGSITGVEQDGDDRAQTKEEGLERWRDFVAQRFVRGGDDDFDYATVDDTDEYDDRDEEARNDLEAYLKGEDAQFIGAGKPVGETGVQDF
ncbi:hypothetical protein LTR36_003982 [Oleoguttula mirabilis]|uniref:CCD97-like C-terminal domain-containing protein n=1 Tax=Oleoguttula mirabilis TaxID=1507867 RepID=A0AAV9JHQ5_9PEZI|nr:hypothetical protein LTR36_003982 [Oleoguttula mirabilis]